MKDLNTFVRKKIRSGYPEGELREELKNQGYTQSDIDELFSSGKTGSRQPSPTYPMWYLVSGGLFILGIALTAVPGLWLQPFSWPLIIIGALGIVIKFLLSK
jgi:hypothetical protein